MTSTQRMVSFLTLFFVMPGFADPAVDRCSCDPKAQTEILRQRLESLRKLGPQAIALSFTGLHQSFMVHHPIAFLKLGDCTYEVARDTSGLIDILLRAKITVGYPAGWENYQPEARFGVFFNFPSSEGLDLWFSNPLNFGVGQVVVGQSHDAGELTAYKITAAGTLRDELWNWVYDHAYPRQDTAARCMEVAKFDPRRSAR